MPITGTEVVAPGLTVQRMALTQGREPTSTITLTPEAPGFGVDSLLIVMYAVRASGPDDLGASCAGGGLPWEFGKFTHFDGSSGGPLSAGFFWAATGENRLTPGGVFPITLTLSGTTDLYAAVCYQADYFSWDMLVSMWEAGQGDPSDSFWALWASDIGDGPLTLKLMGSPYKTPLMRATDVAVALSLAVSEDPPFGATFDAVSGTWDAAPEVSGGGSGGGSGNGWYDDFERADGPLGPNWVQAPGPSWYTVGPLAIEDSAAIFPGEQEDPDRIDAVMYWHEPQGADQSIEVEVSNVLGTGDGYVQLYTNISLNGHECQFVDFQFGTMDPPQITISVYPFLPDGEHDPDYVGHVNWSYPANVPGNEDQPVRLRFDSAADGTQRIYVDGELTLTWVDAEPAVGLYVGMGLEPNTQDPGITSPRILSVNGGGGVFFFDDFVRPDDEIGPNWEVPPNNTFYGQTNYSLLIEDGAAISVEDDFGGTGDTHEISSGRWATPLPGNQFIEVAVTGLDYYYESYPDSQKMFGWLNLFCQADDTSAREECGVKWRVLGNIHPDTGGVASWFSMHAYWLNETGEDVSEEFIAQYDEIPWPPYYDDPTVSVRFECDADGATRLYYDLGADGATTLRAEGVSTSGHTGPYVGFDLAWSKFAAAPDNHGGTSPRVLWAKGGNSYVGGGGDGEETDVSWVTGMRTDSVDPSIAWSDINVGDENIGSAQVALLLEDVHTNLFEWRVGYVDMRAPAIDLDPLNFFLYPQIGSLIVLFVGITSNDPDAVDAIAIDRTPRPGAPELLWSAQRVQRKTGFSWGQGVIFTTIVAPYTDRMLFNGTSGITVSWLGVTLESISVVAYEVRNPHITDPVGVTGSKVIGSHAAGSVNGSTSVILSGAPDLSSLKLGFLHVAATASATSGAATIADGNWFEEVDDASDGEWDCYVHAISSAPGETTTNIVPWADVQTGTAAATSAVLMGIEVRANPTTPFLAPSGIVYLGGRTDPFNGPITEVTATDHTTGEQVWSFP